MDRSFFFLTLIAGLFFPLGFAPVSLPGLALLSLAIFYGLLREKSSRQAYWIGWIYGLGKYGLGVSWIYVCIANFSNAPEIIAIVATFCFIAFLACYEGIMAWCFVRCFSHSNEGIKCLGFALLFILCEWLRSVLFSGFPWLLLGHALIDTPLSNLIPLIGTYGTGFIGALLSALLAIAGRLNKKRYFIFFILPFLLVKPLDNIDWTSTIKSPLKVSLIQGNVSEKRKWVNAHLDDIIDRYVILTENHWSSDLIVWPETALPIPSTYIDSLLSELSEEAEKHRTHLLVGIPFSEKETLSNAMMLLGKNQGLYLKQHLVPFGEYIPLSLFKTIMRFFDIPLGQLTPGTPNQAPMIFNHIYIAPFICYEIAFSQYILPHLPRANLLVTLSDDSWYGHSFAKAQHLQIARVRSLESGRYQLFSTNNGITAIISDKGKVIKALPNETVDTLNAEITLKSGYTPWGHYGDRPIILVLFMLLGACLCAPYLTRNARLFLPH